MTEPTIKNRNTRENDRFRKSRSDGVAVAVIQDTEKLNDTLEVKITNIGTTATRITTPENSNHFFLIHRDSGETLYLGDSSVTASTGLPLPPDEKYPCNFFRKNNNNEIYGIVGSGDINVYAVAEIRG